MIFSTRTGAFGAVCLALAAPAFSAVVGINTPAPEVTAARLAELPASQRAAWADYIARSQKQERYDRDTLAAELQPGETPPPPLAGSSKMPLNKDAAWYGTPEARAIADTIASFQTPSGGWSKNQDRTKPARLRGQRYANDAETMALNTGSFDAPHDRFWTFVGTLDNGATTTEMRFLGRVQARFPGKDGDAYRASIIKGVKYLLMAQYPNGGWPQNYPLEGGFHDGITFNDNAVAEAAMILEDIAEGHADFAFVAQDLRQQAGAASARAIKPILDAQVVVDGKKTVWPQQVDAITLQPISARNYEMRSLASAESSEVLLFLMRQPNPSPEIKASVEAGIAWLKANAIYGKAFTKVSEEEGRKLVDKPGAGPIWSRNYDIRTGKPIFGDWDKSIQDDVNNISKGRRNGYSWYNAAPQKALDVHAEMAAKDIAIAAPQGLSGVIVHAETYGAKGDGVSNDTAALQNAIDATAARKGTLVLQPGVYLTGSLFLKSGMALRIDKGVKLVGAQDIKAYPVMPTRIAGVELSWPAALLNIYEQKDVKVYGEGTVDGNGKVFWDRFQAIRYDYEARGLRWAADYDAQRPRLIQVYNSSRIELGNGPQGAPLNLERSGFWTVQVVYSHDVKVSGITVRNNVDGKGPSTDGVDIDSSHTVLVENADIDANDDALCLKAGRDADGLRVNRPTENVVIRNSTVRSAYAGVTFGSETSGGIRKVRVYGLKVVGPVRYGILFKSAATRGGGASDIDIRDVDVQQAETGIRINLNWFPAYSYAKIPDAIKDYPAYWNTLTAQVPRAQGLPQVRDIRISRVTAKGLKTAVELEGYADAPLNNIRIEDVDLEADALGAIRHARNIQFARSRIVSRNGVPIALEDADNITGFAPVAADVAGVETNWLAAPKRPNTAFTADQLPARAAVLPVLEYVAAAQIADMSRRPIQLSTGSNLSEISSNWVAATFYVGAARLARVSEDKNTLRFLTATAEHYNYAFRGARADRALLNADEVAIGDLYQELYARRRQQGVLMPLQQRLDFMTPHLSRPQETASLIWWWCDALYMAPPVLARQSALTGDPKYLRAMDKEWRRTAARLWVEQDRLFLRDERFKDADHKGAGGKPVYWARGNGWVMGGLARTLESMPASFKGRDFYTGIFRKMASRVAELQQADGLWRSDLNDPKSFPEAETSGSAFFVYALAWGVNHGLLDRQAYQPAVLKGWAALNRHVLPNGLIGAAQKTGDRPVPTSADDVGPYATGAYLLAGLEVMDLHGPVQALPEPAVARDDEATILATTPQPVLPRTVIGEAEKARREQEMRATRALAYDPAALKQPARSQP
ncbi:pectate lyase [Pseudoduganella aquatica]|uniref:pectate lyase n=1 Tax=Pseudoduganella aquatica TaxID=2660641 RepID=UPI001E3F2713|nr:pectate lyase [Pseudoduganella aquatica]